MTNPKTFVCYTQVPNVLIENGLTRINLSPYESRIVWVILRKTFGWHKEEDAISVSQFTQLTGLDRRHVQNTLKKLVERNIVIKNDGLINAYSIQRECAQWKLTAKTSACLGYEVAPKQATEVALVRAPTKETKKYTKKTDKNTFCELSAEKIYEAYPKKVNESRTVKSIKELLESGETVETLLKAVENYKGYISKNGVEEKYIIHSTNFFGQAERYKEYLAVAENTYKNKAELIIEKCLKEGKI